MPAVTAQLLVDLDDSLAFATDITAYWLRDDGFSIPALGRDKDGDKARWMEASFTLDNADGRFTPKNPTSPYFDNLHPFKHIKATVSYNAITYDTFYGAITRIEVDPASNSQRVIVTARDLMYVLDRTDVKIPLMQGYTGPIVNRILDYAEAGEAVSNPRFEEDLGGYVADSGAITRMTTDNLEGSASMKVVSAAVNDGTRYTLGTTYNGDKMTLVAYVRAETDAEFGKTVRIRMIDNVGNIGTGLITALSDRWVRLSVSGTYNVGSATQYIDIEAIASGTTFRVGAVHATPYVSAIPRAVDEGQSIFDAFSTHRGTDRDNGDPSAREAIQEVTKNELGALFYMDYNTAVFEDRHHRWKGDHLTSQATFTERGNPTYEEVADDRVKEVVLDFPRYVEGVLSVLWDLDRVPVAIEASSTLHIEIDYGGAHAKSVVKPVWATDFTAKNVAGQTLGATDLLVTVWHDWGTGAEITLENQLTQTVFLQSLQVRGVPIREASDRTPARYTATGGPQVAAVLSHDYKLNSREPTMQAWAEYLGDRYSTQRERISLSLSAPFPEAAVATTDMTQILARKISDRITLTNNVLPFSLKIAAGQYHIDRVTRTIVGSEDSHVDCDWVLVPVDDLFWILDTSRLETANESRVAV